MPLVYVPNTGIRVPYGAPDGFIEILPQTTNTASTLSSGSFASVIADPLTGMPQVCGGGLEANTTKLVSLSPPYVWTAGVAMPNGVGGMGTSYVVASPVNGSRDWVWMCGTLTTYADTTKIYRFDGTTYNFVSNATATISEAGQAPHFRSATWGTASIGGFHPFGGDADKVEWVSNAGGSSNRTPVLPQKRIDPLAIGISKGTYAGSVYVLGGDPIVGATSSAQPYRRNTDDTWTTLNTYPVATGIWNLAAIELDDGNLFIMGGATNNGASVSDFIANNYIYNPNTDTYQATNASDISAETSQGAGGRRNNYAVRLPDSGRIFVLTSRGSCLLSIPKTRREFENFQSTTVGQFPASMTYFGAGSISHTVADDTTNNNTNICIRSKVLTMSGSVNNDQGYAILNNSVPANAYVQCKLYMVAVQGNVRTGIIVRWTDVNNHIRVFFQNTSNVFVIEEVVAGTPNTVASVAYTSTPVSIPHKYHISVEMSGSSISAKVWDSGANGTGRPVIGATASGTTAITSMGKIGMYIRTVGAAADNRYDELYAEW